MTLLDLLVDEMEEKRPLVPDAQLVHFAFAGAENEQSAYLSSIPIEELVPLMEAWCKWHREHAFVEDGKVH